MAWISTALGVQSWNLSEYPSGEVKLKIQAGEVFKEFILNVEPVELDISEIEKSITGSDYLATFKTLLLSDKIPEGLKFYTTGEGSLKISYEKETADSKSITEVEFVNNFVSSTYIKIETTNVDGDTSVTEAGVNISLSSNVTYPDLSTYTSTH